MLPKPEKRRQAINLRLQGFSLNEISDELDVAKSSASLWVRGISLPKRVLKLLEKKRMFSREKANAVLRARTSARLKEAELLAKSVIDTVHLADEHLKLMCAIVYWCEGTKSPGNSVIFTNSDPKLVQLFLALFRLGFKPEERKFRVCVHLHDYHQSGKQLLFWSKTTGIPITQFIRPYRKPHTGIRKREGYAGCASVRYHDAKIARQVLALARAFLEKGP